MSSKEFLFFILGLIIAFLNFSTFFFLLLSEQKHQRIYNKLGNDAYNGTLADQMFNEVKVLCMVITQPENHKTKAIYVKNTWGKRCNKLLFMSSAHDSVLDPIVLDIPENRTFQWRKTRESFQYVYNNHLDDADWFLKADDDS